MSERIMGIPGDTLVHIGTTASVPAELEHVLPRIKQLHKMGITGEGSIYSINDTGYFNHKDLPPVKEALDFSGSSSVFDKQGHGTHCRGITWSIAPGAIGMSMKVLGDNGSGSTYGINRGRVAAAKAGAHFISESLGDNGGPRIAEDIAAYQEAYKNGVSLCFAALGNAGFNGRNSIGRPGSYNDQNFGIGALMPDFKTPANFSSGGVQAGWAAPGVNIMSTLPGNRWGRMSGTSMATPWMCGLLCLIRQIRKEQGYPDLHGVESWTSFFLENKLFIDLLTPGHDHKTGYGLIDIEKVVDWCIDTTLMA